MTFKTLDPLQIVFRNLAIDKGVQLQSLFIAPETPAKAPAKTTLKTVEIRFRDY